MADTGFRVEIVIACHTPERPLRRAVESVLRDAAPVGIIVVAHGVDPHVFDDHLAGLDRDRVRVIRHDDGIKSAAGPFNAGIAAANSEYVAVMGSDDWLEPGCMTALLKHADESANRAVPPDAVLVPIKHQAGTEIPNPLPRPGRETRLDAVRDRLFYRTAPLGLLRTAVWRAGYEFDASLHAGIDMEPSARLWASGATISYARHAPRYVIGADATSRVSMAPVPIRMIMGSVLSTAQALWTRHVSARVRRALAIKLARIHVLGFVYARATRDGDPNSLFTTDDVAALRDATSALTELSPRWRDPFSIADRWVLDRLTFPETTGHDIVAAARRRAEAGMWQRQIPRKPWHAVDRESNPVRVLLIALDRRRLRANVATTDFGTSSSEQDG